MAANLDLDWLGDWWIFCIFLYVGRNNTNVDWYLSRQDRPVAKNKEQTQSTDTSTMTTKRIALSHPNSANIGCKEQKLSPKRRAQPALRLALSAMAKSSLFSCRRQQNLTRSIQKPLSEQRAYATRYCQALQLNGQFQQCDHAWKALFKHSPFKPSLSNKNKPLCGNLKFRAKEVATTKKARHSFYYTTT